MIPILNEFDPAVLRCLSETGECRARGRSARFGRSRPYVRARLPTLLETAYMRAIGSEPRFHAYELTSKGAAVARRMDDATEA